ncbi:MAG: hypothetical protein ACE5DX_02805 [Candidatus Dojkabacteria bacterium]
MLPTPGHAHEHTALVVEVNGKVYVVAEDVFWWWDGEQKSNTVKDLMELEDPFVKDKEALKRSRKKVLEIADFIIPGHGVMFRNPAKE